MDLRGTAAWIDGRLVRREATVPVLDPWDGSEVAVLGEATAEDVDRAVDSARQALALWRQTPAHRRAEILWRVAEVLAARGDEAVGIMAREVGKPVRDGRLEVSRAVSVWRLAAATALELFGETVPTDATPRGVGRVGMVLREPVGVVAGITPFNFPLNLVVHKVAPALAGGNTVVLKPSVAGAWTALWLVHILHEAGIPAGAVNVVLGDAAVGEHLVRHPGVDMVSFTGGLRAGLAVRAAAGVKPVALELGGNAPNLVFPGADLSAVARALALGGFASAGQSCISVQRIYVHEAEAEAFTEALVAAAREVPAGDPKDEGTVVGPLINDQAVARVLAWLEEAKAEGAEILTGGRAHGRLLEPTVVRRVPPGCRIQSEEVFAPVVTVTPFATEEEAISLANATRYGLQAGVFTPDVDQAMRVARALEFGGVWINEISNFRLDNYPYGGVKQSGTAREGVKYAVLEMTRTKFVGINVRNA